MTKTADVRWFGTDEVSDEVNLTIFKAVQKYIKTSKRFVNYSTYALVSWTLVQNKTNPCISTLLLCKNSA